MSSYRIVGPSCYRCPIRDNQRSQTLEAAISPDGPPETRALERPKIFFVSLINYRDRSQAVPNTVA